MAHTRIVNQDARIISQCAKGRYIRNVEKVIFSVGQARGNNSDPNLIMADAIKSEFSIKGVFVAPCAGKVVGVYVNGSPYVDMAAGGTVYVLVYKTAAGSATAFITDNSASGIKVGSETVPSPDVAIDGTLSTTTSDLEFTVGQLIYARLTVSAHNVDARGFITVCVEWIPTDAAYASS